MKKLTHLTVLMILLSPLAMSLTACGGPTGDQSSGKLAGNIAISGAWALYPMMTRWME